MTPGATGAPGIPCPECGETIPVSVDALVAGSGFRCPGCGLALEVDREKSARSLELLQNLEEGQRKARELTRR